MPIGDAVVLLRKPLLSSANPAHPDRSAAPMTGAGIVDSAQLFLECLDPGFRHVVVAGKFRPSGNSAANLIQYQ